MMSNLPRIFVVTALVGSCRSGGADFQSLRTVTTFVLVPSGPLPRAPPQSPNSRSRFNKSRIGVVCAGACAA